MKKKRGEKELSFLTKKKKKEKKKERKGKDRLFLPTTWPGKRIASSLISSEKRGMPQSAYLYAKGRGEKKILLREEKGKGLNPRSPREREREREKKKKGEGSPLIFSISGEKRRRGELAAQQVLWPGRERKARRSGAEGNEERKREGKGERLTLAQKKGKEKGGKSLAVPGKRGRKKKGKSRPLFPPREKKEEE